MPTLASLFSKSGFLKWDGAGNTTSDFTTENETDLAGDTAFTGAFVPHSTTANLPDAATYSGRIVWNTDESEWQRSNGTAWVPWAGFAPTTRWWNGGTAGNYWATPDHNDFDFAGDVEIVVLVALADYTPASTQILVSKRTAGAGLAFQLALSTAGTLKWSFRTGAADKFDDGTLTAPSALVDGTPYWFKFTRTSATGAIAGGHAPASASEPSSFTAWTPSGTRTAGAIDANAAEVAVGGERAGTTVLSGSVYRAILRDGIGGTTVGDLRLDGPVGTRFRDTDSKVWTATGSAWAWEVRDPLA